jgi:pentatricopeptide repeat protein
MAGIATEQIADEDGSKKGDAKPEDVAKGKGKGDVNIQVACVTLAKGQHRRFPDLGTSRRALTARDKGSYTSNVKSHMFNHIVCFSADAGRLGSAENWMDKLDGQSGINPEVRSLNTLLLSIAKAGDYDRAEEWFTKCQTPVIHPQFVGLQPDAESYNILIQMFSGAGMIQRAEKWFELIQSDLGIRPTLATQIGLIRTCLQSKEIRRAHRWAKSLIDSGCPQNPNYAPEVVKTERAKFRSQRDWDVGGLINCLFAVVEALAAIGNARTANEWLQYFTHCGMKPQQSPEVWEKVRRVHPREIVACILSGEQDDPFSPPLPPRTKPATLHGEGWKSHSSRSSKHDGALVPLNDSSFRGGASMSKQSISRPESSCMSGRSSPRVARAALSDTGKRSGAVSPSLRKFLDARHRGAEPSLAWARGERRKTVEDAHVEVEEGVSPCLVEAEAAS